LKSVRYRILSCYPIQTIAVKCRCYGQIVAGGCSISLWMIRVSPNDGPFQADCSRNLAIKKTMNICFYDRYSFDGYGIITVKTVGFIEVNKSMDFSSYGMA